jgi:hypothetical protein
VFAFVLLAGSLDDRTIGHSDLYLKNRGYGSGVMISRELHYKAVIHYKHFMQSFKPGLCKDVSSCPMRLHYKIQTESQ